MEVDKGALLKALKKLMPGVGSGAKILEGSDSIIISEKGLHSFNREISVTVPFEFDESLRGTVNAVDFFNVLNNKRLRVISDSLEVERKEGVIVFTGNDWNCELTYKEDSQWMTDKIDMLNSVICNKELPTDFVKAMNLCSIKTNKTNYHGVYVKGKDMFATNKAVCNYFTFKEDLGEFWIGQQEVNELLKIAGVFHKYAISVTQLGHWVHFEDTDGTVFSVTTKDCSLYTKAYNFLEKNKDIYPTNKKLMGTIPTGFADAIATCSLMASKVDYSKKKVVIFTFTPTNMVVKGIKIDGKLTNTIPWDEGEEMPITEDLTVSFIGENIIDASRKAKNFFLNKMETGSYIFVITDGEFKTIILSLQS